MLRSPSLTEGRVDVVRLFRGGRWLLNIWGNMVAHRAVRNANSIDFAAILAGQSHCGFACDRRGGFERAGISM